jgi:hypothetical protein
MGTLRGDNGGGRPPDGGGLPDLPPEWGTVVIPDDLAELDEEAAAIRRDFRREARRNRWRRRLGRAPVYRISDDDSPALGLPLLIMSIAIIATLTSLFAIAWPARSNRPTQPATRQSAPASVPDVLLTNSAGHQFRVRESLPAVILLVDGCACDQLVSQTAAAVEPSTSVIVVGRSVPSLPAGLSSGREVIAAADSDGALRSAYPGAGATAILAGRSGAVVDAVHEVSTAETFKQYLPGLT